MMHPSPSENRSPGAGRRTWAEGVNRERYHENNPLPLEDQVVSTLRFLHPGEVFEICAISPMQDSSPLWEGRAFGKKKIVAGWFRDPEKAAKMAVQIKAEGIYTTLNPSQEALLARTDHRLKANVDRTADQHIAGIKNLLIDIDPKRPAGISSTDHDHEAALEMAGIIRADLTNEKWPEPLLGDSGNGGHLIYPLDLQNEPESVDLVKAVLEAMALRYKEVLHSKNLEIDLKVFNPARLTKLYGTRARKGDNTPERPHRLARIISLPEARLHVPVDLLKELAATALRRETQQEKKRNGGTGTGRLDVGAYLARYGMDVVKTKPHADGHLYCLQECIFDPSHSPNEAAIYQAADGTLSYQCFHNSCQGRNWAEARTKISGQDKLGDFGIDEYTEKLNQEKPKEQEKRTHNFSLISASHLISEPETETRWVWDGVLPQGGMSLAVAKPKFGKTTMAINLSVAVSRGDPFLGRDTVKTPVIYLALEEKRSEVGKKLKALKIENEPLLFHFGLAPKKGIDEVGLLVAETGAGLLVVDTLQKLARVKDLNDYAQVTTSLEPLLAVARQFNCHILLLHHAGKAERRDGDEVLGSTALLGAVDTAIFLKKRDERRTFSTIQRYGDNLPETVLTMAEDFSLSVQGTLAEAKRTDIWERIKSLLEENPGQSEVEIAENLGIRKMEVSITLRWALRQEPPLLERQGEGKRGKPFLFSCSAVPAYIREQREQKPKTTITNENDLLITVPKVEGMTVYPGTETGTELQGQLMAWDGAVDQEVERAVSSLDDGQNVREVDI